MVKRYDCSNRSAYERALKEILQEVTLVGLWRARFFEHAAFYGGTALRILYGLDRFSEDLDFTLLHPDPHFSLKRYNEAIASELISYGFSVFVDSKDKTWQTPIQSAFIKANTVGELLKIGVPSQLVRGLPPDTKLKIKIEVDTDPAPAYQVETRFLVQPVNVGIRSVILRDIFAGKMHALLFRQWKGRVKGRDWYDWLWLLRQAIPLELERLAIHMRQSGFLSPDEALTPEQFRELLKERIDKVDLDSAKADVAPFIQDTELLTAWSRELFHYFASRTELA